MKQESMTISEYLMRRYSVDDEIKKSVTWTTVVHISGVPNKAVSAFGTTNSREKTLVFFDDASEKVYPSNTMILLSDK